MKFKVVKLEDVSIGKKGSYGVGASAVEFSKDLYTYLRITDINEDGTLNTKDMKSVKDKNAEKYLLKNGDIVFARTGNSTGKTYFYDGKIKDLVYAGFLIKFSINSEKINPKYIKYYTLTDEYKNWVNEIQTGSTRGNINAQTYGKLEIKIPDRSYQDRMVQILGLIDAKIELNNKINDNLQKLGEELIKQETDKSDNLIIFKDIIKFVKGKKPNNISKTKEYGYLDYLTIANLKNQEKIYADVEKTVLAKNDILMVMDGASSGDVYYSSYGIVGSTLSKIEIIDSRYNSGKVYFMLNYYKKQIKSKNTGSAIPHTDKEFIYKLHICGSNEIKKSIYQNILDCISDINNQSNSLMNLRDTLLPKLINGEINLDKIEI